ncbi:MAG: hypothetical protein ACYSRR_03885 [Planctomycetota bacterium]|jgi:hypothetical protein
MFQKIISILTVTFFLFAGCQGRSVSNSLDKNATSAEMIEYLHRANLPAVRAVENWQNEYGPGLKITTDHYEILTTLLEPLILRDVPAFMESCHRAYNSQLEKPIETKTALRIYIFSQRSQWDDFTVSFAGRRATTLLRIKKGAYYLNGDCVAYFIGRDRTFSTLAHEGWHQFNSRHFKFRLPSWLDEGVAMLFEASVQREGFFYFEPARNMYRLGELKKTIAKNKMLPLRELVITNPGQVLASDPNAVAAVYSQSYALIRFLREDNYSSRFASYRRLLTDGLEGNWPLSETAGQIATDRNINLTSAWNRIIGPELFKRYIDEDFEKIEKEYITFCRKIVYHVKFK